MTITETVTLVLVAERCATCGVVYGIESGHQTALRESHEAFFCTNGHSQHYPAQTEKERRIAELERETRSLKSSRDFWSEQSKTANREVERKSRQVNGYKGVVTRLKRRAVAGRCPCCSHQFKDLKRHMATQHPQWNPDVEGNQRAAKSAAPAGEA